MSERAFKTSEFLMQCFEEYLRYAIENGRFVNIAGFCAFKEGHLKDFRIHRDTYYAQENYYSDTIKIIDTILEDETWNSNALSAAEKIFYSKNKFGMVDKVETENVNLNHDMTPEEADKIIKKLGGTSD